MATFKKDPDAVLDYTYDWGPYLLPLADTIVSVSWVLPTALTKVSESRTTTTATIYVSGGVADTSETVTCRIVTAGGRTDDRSITLKITNR
jgi:hypothetical protein